MSIWDYANPQLRDLVAYVPGKPIEDVARELGLDPSQIIKLASNENPLGPSPFAKKAMLEALDRAHFYPDGGGYYLREAIAGQLGLKIGNVILGNGSNEIIEFLGRAFLQPGDEIITAEHAFVVYKIMARLSGADTREIADPGFTHDLEAMAAAVGAHTKLIFVANPNNPTGTLVGREAIERFMEKIPDHVIVVFDEAYYEFLREAPDTLKFLQTHDNVVILRTFSKIQGLASLRIGYGLGSENLIAVLQKTRQPFNANAVAQAGALAGLLDLAHQERTRQITFEGRDYLEGEFTELGLEYVPSHANFVLVRVGDGNALFKALLRKGVIIRAMAEYKLPDWIRVSIGTMPQNRRFIEELTAWLTLQPVPVA